jgi:demethylspheroidene O-methyltransferase
MREMWLGLRNRVLASRRFQRWAMRLPLTRPVARRRAGAAFDLVAGFVYSQVLHACVELDLLGMLEAPRTAGDVAARTGLSEAAALRLLKAAAAIGLVEAVGERFMLGRHGAVLAANPGVAEMIAHHRMLYADLADPVALLRRGEGGGELARFWAYRASAGAGEVDPYSALMAASQPLVAEEVLAAYPLGRHTHLLDIGGGSGTFALAAASAAPQLKVTVFDLPAVADTARRRFEEAGLGDRAAAVGGDFFADSLPGADLVTLVRVLHDHDDAPAAALLANIRRALAPGATLLIAEPMAGKRGHAPMGDAYFGMYLLAMGSGQPRTPAEIIAMAKAAGFASARPKHTASPMTTQLVVATA